MEVPRAEPSNEFLDGVPTPVGSIDLPYRNQHVWGGAMGLGAVGSDWLKFTKRTLNGSLSLVYLYQKNTKIWRSVSKAVGSEFLATQREFNPSQRGVAFLGVLPCFGLFELGSQRFWSSSSPLSNSSGWTGPTRRL